MGNLENIIIHCSDSSFGDANEIRRWHLEKGWRDIGYHFVILNGFILKDFHLKSLDGSIECGRPLNGDNIITGNEVGAHTLGYNANSIGICLIGIRIFSNNQMQSLYNLLHDLCRTFKIPVINVLGHCETDSGKEQYKTCPNFDMVLIREKLKLHSDTL